MKFPENNFHFLVLICNFNELNISNKLAYVYFTIFTRLLIQIGICINLLHGYRGYKAYNHSSYDALATTSTLFFSSMLFI